MPKPARLISDGSCSRVLLRQGGKCSPRHLSHPLPINRVVVAVANNSLVSLCTQTFHFVSGRSCFKILLSIAIRHGSQLQLMWCDVMFGRRPPPPPIDHYLGVESCNARVFISDTHKRIAFPLWWWSQCNLIICYVKRQVEMAVRLPAAAAATD